MHLLKSSKSIANASWASGASRGDSHGVRGNSRGDVPKPSAASGFMFQEPTPGGAGMIEKLAQALC